MAPGHYKIVCYFIILMYKNAVVSVSCMFGGQSRIKDWTDWVGFLHRGGE